MLALNKELLEQPLTPIGSVAVLGAEVIDGDPQASGLELLGTMGVDQNCVGVFACSQGRFQVEHSFAEHATLLEGELVLINLVTGTEQRFLAGDSWYIAIGDKIEWQIRSDRIVKHYLANF